MKCADLPRRLFQVLPTASHRRPRRRHLAFESFENKSLLSAFYVAPGGSNSADGSAQHPWATIQKAANTVKRWRYGLCRSWELQRCRHHEHKRDRRRPDQVHLDCSLGRKHHQRGRHKRYSLVQRRKLCCYPGIFVLWKFEDWHL